MKWFVLSTTLCLSLSIVTGVFGQDALSKPGAVTQANESSAVTKRAVEILNRAIETYHKSPALTDTLDMSIDFPAFAKQTMTFDLSMDEHGNSRIDSTNLFLAVIGKNIFIQDLKFPRKYVQIEITSTLKDALSPTNIGLPFQYVMRGETRPTFDELLQAISPGAASGMVVTKVEENKSVDGGVRTVIHLTSSAGDEAGTMTIFVDPKTNFLRRIVMVQGSEGQSQHGTVTIDLNPKMYQSLPEKIAFDSSGKKRVERMQDLVLTVGDEAPDFTLESSDGGTVTLSELRGNVVVLDFWATWCGPCIKGLPMLDEFNTWAKNSGQPIKVFAVNVWEKNPTLDARKSSALGFWQVRGFKLPTLLDLDYKVAGQYGFQSIPTTIIVAPDGTISIMHNGLQMNMVDMLKDEVQEALKSTVAGPRAAP